MNKKRTEAATGRSHAPNQTFVAFPSNSDEPIGIRVKCHEDYAAELEAERMAAGNDWHDSSYEYFSQFWKGRG